MKTLNLTPLPSLMEANRSIGYSFNSAIADIIDNSIDAKASEVQILAKVHPAPFIAILDNGFGMTLDELQEAMRYGGKRFSFSDRENTSLGRFGLGLKTASLSQCTNLTVLSKKQGKISGAIWDLNLVVSTQEWNLCILEDEDIKNLNPEFLNLINLNETGTLVIWNNLDRVCSSLNNSERQQAEFFDKIEELKKHLSLVFHRYLSGDKDIKHLNIKINNFPLKPIDPFFTEKSTQLTDCEFTKFHDEYVEATPYMLPSANRLTQEEIEKLGGDKGLRASQGFYIYRNKRLIVWGSWFRVVKQLETSKNIRIKVDISNALDEYWELDIKKSSAMPPPLIKERLRKMVETLQLKAKRNIEASSRKNLNDDSNYIFMWQKKTSEDKSIKYVINKAHPLIKDLFSDPSVALKLNLIFKKIEKDLPCSDIYLENVGDRKITNDNEEFTFEEVREEISVFIKEKKTLEQKQAYFKKLIETPEFSKYAEALQKLFDENQL